MRIKICGITNPKDAELAAKLGCDAIGLNFYHRSKRCISTETAGLILRDLPPFIEPVGLFVNEPLDEVCEFARGLPLLRTLQIHADRHEPLPDVPFRFIHAFAIRDAESLQSIDRFLDLCRQQRTMPQAVLVDAFLPGEYGGTGRVAPWHLLASYHPSVPLVLAGGLTADNVAEAIRIVRPYAVDVASGVESEPGKKDLEKMKRFIEAARAAI